MRQYVFCSILMAFAGCSDSEFESQTRTSRGTSKSNLNGEAGLPATSSDSLFSDGYADAGDGGSDDEYDGGDGVIIFGGSGGDSDADEFEGGNDGDESSLPLESGGDGDQGGAPLESGGDGDQGGVPLESGGDGDEYTPQLACRIDIPAGNLWQGETYRFTVTSTGEAPSAYAVNTGNGFLSGNTQDRAFANAGQFTITGRVSKSGVSVPCSQTVNILETPRVEFWIVPAGGTKRKEAHFAFPNRYNYSFEMKMVNVTNCRIDWGNTIPGGNDAGSIPIPVATTTKQWWKTHDFTIGYGLKCTSSKTGEELADFAIARVLKIDLVWPAVAQPSHLMVEVSQAGSPSACTMQVGNQASQNVTFYTHDIQEDAGIGEASAQRYYNGRDGNAVTGISQNQTVKVTCEMYGPGGQVITHTVTSPPWN